MDFHLDWTLDNLRELGQICYFLREPVNPNILR